MRIRLIILFITIPFFISGQEGIPYISHFRDRSDLNIQNWAVCQTEQNVMLFANRLGITSFDGNRWITARMPHIPFELKRHPVSNTIYVGAGNNYGFLSRNPEGELEYNSLSGDSTNIGAITRIYFTGSSVCFAGNRTISIHDIDNPANSKRWYSERDKLFTGFIATGDKFFINVEGSGLHRIDSDTLFPIVTGYLTKDAEILFMVPHSSGRVLIGTSENRLFLFDGIKYYPYSLSNDDFLIGSVLSDGVAVTDSTYAFSTLYGGAVLVNQSDGKIVHLLDFQNGLPDDEIYAIGTDNNHGLWIIHGLGICRADLSLPLRNFSVYPGIIGMVTTTLYHNNQLYVGTNEGLWYLDELRNYTEVEVLQKRTVERQPERIIPKVQINQPVESTIEVPEKDETKESGSIKGLFSKLFNRKSDEQEETPIEIKVQEKISEPSKENIAAGQPEPVKIERYVKRKVSTLKSIDHVFRKVEGLNARCNQIVATENGLLVATTAGLFSVENSEAKAITDNRFINSITYSGIKGIYYIGGDNGIMEVNNSKEGWVAETGMFGINEPVYSISAENPDMIWASGNNIVFSFEKGIRESVSTRTYTFQSDFPERAKVSFVNDTLMLLTESGISYFSYDEGLLIPYLRDNNFASEGINSRFLISSPGIPWINPGNGWTSLVRDMDGLEELETFLRVFDNIVSIISDDKGSYWITDDESGIFRISGFEQSDFDPIFNIFINNVSTSDELFFDLTNLVFEPFNHLIHVNISAPHFIKETSTQYQYFIDELYKEWSPWSNNPNIDIPLFPKSGSYTIRLRARNILGNISQEKVFSFTIKPPFTRSVWFYILISLGALGIIMALIYVREGKLRHDKKVLEEKVVERTLEIELKKKQIEIQRDEILKQKEEITSSITYASRIQDAILPGQKQFRKIFKEFFIIFKPRDIVSGDFYWIDESDNRVSIAVADCTGHGVPGAIMSMLGISLLNEITANASDKISASAVLGLLREKVIFSLNQSGRDNEANDGMDIAYCILDKKRKRLEYAGAFNPLYLIRKGVLIEYKADRMPIGYHIKQSQFTNHDIELKKGDILYIFSDGYYDQFGGPNDKRFSSGRLKKMLKEVSSLPMEEQKEIIESRYQDWKKETEQVDDIIFLGVRI